jgi:hypothetical protein
MRGIMSGFGKFFKQVYEGVPAVEKVFQGCSTGSKGFSSRFGRVSQEFLTEKLVELLGS